MIEVYSDALGFIQQSTVFSVTVNGQPVLVDEYRDLHIVWFGDDFDAAVTVEVIVSETVITHRLSPTAHGTTTAVDGSIITFSLDQPRQLMLWEINALDDRLLIIADYPDDDIPDPADSDVDNILNAGVDAMGQTDDTLKIQGAIDALGSDDTLYFPAGCYRANRLTLKSNMTIYLAAGTRLKVWGDGASGTEWITATGQNNITIRGRGILDGHEVGGDGQYHYNTRWYACAGLTIENVLAYNSYRHNFQVLQSCSDILLKRVYSLTTSTLSGGTGLHLTSSHDILVEDCFTYSMDDGICIQSIGHSPPAPQYNIDVRRHTAFLQELGGVVALTTNYGHDEIADTHDITVEDVWAIQTDRIVKCNSVCGSSIYNVTISDVYVERITGNAFEIWVYDSPDSWWEGQYDCCRDEDESWDGTPGTIHDVAFSNIVCEDWGLENNDIGYYGQCRKTHETAIYDVAFNDWVVAGDTISDLVEGRFSIGAGLRNITFTDEVALSAPVARFLDLNHETGSLEEYDSIVGESELLSVSAAAAQVGNYGLALQLDGARDVYGLTSLDFAGRCLRMDFCFDTNNFENSGGMFFVKCLANNSTRTGVKSSCGFNASYYSFMSMMRLDSGALDSILFYPTQGKHTLTLIYSRASSATAQDGGHAVYLDGVLVGKSTGLDTFDLSLPNQVRVGLIDADAGSTGVFYLDDIIISGGDLMSVVTDLQATEASLREKAVELVAQADVIAQTILTLQALDDQLDAAADTIDAE